MKIQKKKRNGFQGSYTIETALLMGLLLPLLFGILWAGLLLYEKGVLQGTASECVFLENMKSRMEETGEENKKLQEQSLQKAKLSLEIMRLENKVAVQGTGQALIPGILGSFLKGGTITWEVREEGSNGDGIRKIREICQQRALMESGG